VRVVYDLEPSILMKTKHKTKPIVTIAEPVCRGKFNTAKSAAAVIR